MSAFMPDVGTLFYAKATRVVVEIGMGGTVTTTKTIREGHDNIFRCVAVDHFVVIGEVVYGYKGTDAKRMLRQHEFQFFAVGPEVVQALGLEA